MDGDIEAVGCAVDDTYGLMSIDGEPTPACLAKQLFAQHVRYGDCIRFPARNAARRRQPSSRGAMRAAAAACSSTRPPHRVH